MNFRAEESVKTYKINYKRKTVKYFVFKSEYSGIFKIKYGRNIFVSTNKIYYSYI